MSELKKGDRVRLKSGITFSNGECVATVAGVNSWGDVCLEETYECFPCARLVTAYTNPPHKHAEVIKAWADGAEIELWSTFERRWKDLTAEWPAWCEDILYRIKPQPEAHPNEEKIAEIETTISELQQQVKELKSVCG